MNLSPELLAGLQFITWAVLLAVYLGRKWLFDRIGLITQKDLASYKADLEKSNAAELETLKAGLQRDANYEEIQFTNLLKEQAPIFKGFYEKIALTHDAAITFVSTKPGSTKLGDNHTKLYQSIIDCRSYFDKNRIYFTETVCKNFDNFTVAQLGVYSKGKAFRDDANYIATDEGKKDWKQIFDWAMNFGSSMKSKIETEIRIIIGVQPTI